MKGIFSTKVTSPLPRVLNTTNTLKQRALLLEEDIYDYLAQRISLLTEILSNISHYFFFPPQGVLQGPLPVKLNN